MNIEASVWLEKNYERLVQEFNNQWIGVSSEKCVSSGKTFDLVVQNVKEQETALSKITFVYLTKEAVQ